MTIYDDNIKSIYRLKENATKWRTTENVMDSQSLVCAAKRVIFGEKSQKLSHKEHCEVMRFIIRDILEIDESVFYNIYSTSTLHDLRIKNLANLIVKTAPEEVKIKCLFNYKRILFASVYPDFYEKVFPQIESSDIYYCSGDIKSSLKKASMIRLDSLRDGEELTDQKKKDGTYKKERASKAKGLHGKQIDELLYHALDEILTVNGMEEFVDKLDFLATVKSFYNSQNTQMPGIYSIIEARGCYDSPLDFYMLNSPVDIQHENFFEYIKIRRQAQGTNELLDMILSAYEAEHGITYDEYFGQKKIADPER